MKADSRYGKASPDTMPDTDNTTPAERARVAIVRADEYELPPLRDAVAEALGLIGGLETLIKPGARVFVKINHLPPPSPPERGIVTHPVFAEAVVELLKEAGAVITLGDDIESDTDGFSISGFRQMCVRSGVRLVNLREEGFVEVAGGEALPRLHLARAAVEADVVVNLPKLKTHMLTVYTGAVKNMYGTLPVGLRRRYHADFTHTDDFALMLTDVFAANIPQLTLMDAVYAMQGMGPAGGTMRRLGVILAGRDGVAVDTVAARIIGLGADDVDTTRHCRRRGLGVGRLEDIEIAGEKLENVLASDFRLPASTARAIIRRVPGPLARWAVSLSSVKPKVIGDKCTACSECVAACPVEAIVIAGGIAKIDGGKCLECHCCSEACRHDAISARLSAATVAANFVGSLKRS
jgi:uncharacterized protein (DUF362 family)/Pyruvate/2-oxoacid:ferredoxin oxidoreductase delta subunit